MRFFRPTLAPLKSCYSSFLFDVNTKHIQSIWVSHDLSHLQVRCQKTIDAKKKRMIHSSLDTSLSQIPLFLPLWMSQSSFHVFGLADINLKLQETAKKLMKEDPFFFSNLEESVEYDDEEIAQSVLTLTPLRCQYFSLEAVRQDRVQHTVELPLKSLQKNGFLTQDDINKMLTAIYPRVNAIRAQKKDPIKLPESTDVPHLFR